MEESMTKPSDPPAVVAEGKYIQLVKQGKWEYVRRRGISGIVAIVAVTDDGKLVLVEQYRAPVGHRVIELPAGLAGDVAGSEDEALATAAARELFEETGYEAREMTLLGAGTASAGICDEVITLFRATGLKKTGPGAGDGGEQITVVEVPLAGAEKWLADKVKEGYLIDLKVYGGLYFANAPR
jgi:ADP-ribose pyrophosphatase